MFDYYDDFYYDYVHDDGIHDDYDLPWLWSAWIYEKHELIQLPDGHEEYVGIGKSQPILKR